jgi:hypothetical protein
VGLLSIKKQSAVSVSIPATDHLNLFIDSFDDILKTKDNSGIVRPSGVGTADELATTGAPVDVSASPPPVAGNVLTATSPTTAVWQAVASVHQTAIQVGPVTYGASIGDLVRANVSAGTVTVNLPTAVGNVDREIWIKLVSVATFACVVNCVGAETIDGSGAVSLTTDGEWLILRSDGANWMQMG